jgi:hypothetical protein
MDGTDIERLAKIAVDCGFRIHDDIGPGLLETAYEAFLAARLAECGLRVEVQKPVPVKYRGVFIETPSAPTSLSTEGSSSRSSRWSGWPLYTQNNCSPTSA